LLPLQTETCHQPVERGGQHVLVGDPGAGAAGAGEGDPVAAEDEGVAREGGMGHGVHLSVAGVVAAAARGSTRVLVGRSRGRICGGTVAREPTGLDTLGSVNATTQAPVDGRSARWARHREQRRAELLDVARHLIHEKGPDVTMEDIAGASGTSKSIVYRYFEDKAQLQRALGRSILSTMHE